MVYHGGGGFILSEVYCLPVYLRKFYLKELVDSKKRENESTKKQDEVPGQVPKFMKGRQK